MEKLHYNGPKRLKMILLYAVIGIFSGVTSGLFGLGGGTTIVPAMLSLGLSAHHAIGVSVLQMIFASIFGSILNYKKRLFSFREGLFLGIGGLIGASFSGVILSVLSEVALESVFLALMCYSFYQFAFGKKRKQESANINMSLKKENLILIFAGTLTGIFAISLGVGGGLIMMPILIRFLGYDTKKISTLALFFIIFSSVSGSYSLFSHGVIDATVVHIGLIIGIASMFGVSIGIFMMEKISGIWHRRLLSWVYVISISTTAFSLIQKL